MQDENQPTSCNTDTELALTPMQDMELCLVPKSTSHVPVNHLAPKPVFDWPTQFAA